MGPSAFTERSHRVAADGRVVCDTLAPAAQIVALRDALAWRRHQLSIGALEDAGAVLGLRDVTALDDRLAAALAIGSPAPLTFDRAQARILCEVSGAYVAERDAEHYQAPAERERIALLRALGGPLMDSCCDLAGAEDEARDKALLP